jgi:hypothetical protein
MKKEKEEIPAQRLASPFAAFDISEESLDHLENSVDQSLSDDVKAGIAIRPLLRTAKTKRNSLSDLYRYLADRKVCASCDGQLSHCPKKDGPGYRLAPYYDPTLDAIRTEREHCPLLEEKRKALAQIRPADCGSENIFLAAVDVIRYVSQNGDKMKDTVAAVQKTLNDLAAFTVGKPVLGQAFFAPNGDILAKKLLRFYAYMAAKLNHRVAYIDAADLFSALKDKDYEVVEEAKRDLAIAKTVPALALEGLDHLPRYANDLFPTELVALLEARAEPKKITYLALSTTQELTTLLGSYLYQSEQKARAQALIGKIARKVRIRDLAL